MKRIGPAIIQHSSELHPLHAVAAVAGSALIIASRRERQQGIRVIEAALGSVLLAVAAQPIVFNAIRIAGTRRRTIRLEFTLVVDQPVERTFAYFANFENLPRVIGGLREVRDSGDGRSHWRAATPAGNTLEWDALTTRFVTNSVISWRSTLNAPVVTCGTLRFMPDGERTTVAVKVDYCVLDGRFRDALAALVKPSNESALESDLREFSLR